MKVNILDFNIGNQFPATFIGKTNLNIPNTVNANGKKFKKAWDLLIELDVCEYLDENKKVLVDNTGIKYSGNKRKDFYYKRRRVYYFAINDILKTIDYKTLSKDIAKHVTKTKIRAFLTCIMNFFISIEAYEICADIKKYINFIIDSEYEGLRQLIKDILAD